jgi:hypothetical protein
MKIRELKLFLIYHVPHEVVEAIMFR